MWAIQTMSLSARRAWIEILFAGGVVGIIGRSLSARRAWIEIAKPRKRGDVCRVALRKESVDRNVDSSLLKAPKTVALRKESVDRNQRLKEYRLIMLRRSPQGERG